MTIRTYELRIYSLSSAEDVQSYGTTYYPNHAVSLQELFGVTVHGYWNAISSNAFQFYVLMSFPAGVDPDEVRRKYREHPASTANMPGFDPSVIRDVSVALLAPATQSPLQ